MFNKDTTIGDILNEGEQYKIVFEGFGMHCFSCPMALMETVEEAAEVHGIDVELMLEKLNEISEEK